MAKLTAAAVKGAKEPGRYGDGDGLYLLVAKGGSKSWMVRVQKDGTRRDIGLGSAAKKTLADARRDASAVRSQVEAGVDPVLERKRSASVPTFREAAARVHAEHRKAWRNAKHSDQWLRTLEVHAFPAIGDLSVADIEHGQVRDLLAPIWLEKPETARRVFQRVRTVLDWAFSKQFRAAELPTRGVMRGLPRHSRKVEHVKALPYAEMPACMVRLRERDSVSRLALQALILTAVRSGSLRKATWDQFDLERQVWTIPAPNMKGAAEYVVPLSAAAMEVFRRVAPYRRGDSGLVFPGQKRDKPISDMTMNKLLARLGIDAKPHGFRSSFRDWAAECTSFPAEVAEMALSHAIKNKVEAAYRRGNLLEKRRSLMDAWGRYCVGDFTSVVSFPAAVA